MIRTRCQGMTDTIAYEYRMATGRRLIITNFYYQIAIWLITIETSQRFVLNDFSNRTFMLILSLLNLTN